MKHFRRWFYRVGLVTACLLAMLSVPIYADSNESAPQLMIDQVKLTTDQQFVRIFNAGDAVADLSDYELFYTSTSGTNKTFVFDTLKIDPGEYYIMSEGQMTVCYQAFIDSISLGFAIGSSSTTGGGLQLWRYADAAKTSKIKEDDISWRNKIPVTSDITALPKEEPESVFFQRFPAGSAKTWQAVRYDTTDPCLLNSVSDANTPVADTTTHFTAGTVPPVNIVVVPEGYVAPKNIDLIAPVINELLPNPGSPGTDSEDEFVEIYNPNSTTFDLGGYKLLYGTGTPKSFKFPEGTMLEPLSYTAFYSANTSIALGNSGGQAWLTDANGTVLSQTAAYGTAKDNQAWALANGNWVWMVRATPAAPNNGQVVLAASKTTKAAKASVTGNVKGASTVTPSGTEAASELEDAAPLHPLVLVGVGAAAVGYACYEYRHDVANQLFRLRRYIANRRALRAKV